MSAQKITETITNLKKALARWERNDTYDHPDEPVAKPTNRGIKLHQGSEYVRARALAPAYGRRFFRKRARLAGYERDVHEYNPPVYDSDGNEIELDDERRVAAALADDTMTFNDVRLEALLCPLRHPSELECHPSMAEPYRSRVLQQMIFSIDERLQRERAVLQKAKRLHRELLGDVPWLPAGFLETDADRELFMPPWMLELRSGNDGNHDGDDDDGRRHGEREQSDEEAGKEEHGHGGAAAGGSRKGSEGRTDGTDGDVATSQEGKARGKTEEAATADETANAMDLDDRTMSRETQLGDTKLKQEPDGDQELAAVAGTDAQNHTSATADGTDAPAGADRTQPHLTADPQPAADIVPSIEHDDVTPDEQRPRRMTTRSSTLANGNSNGNGAANGTIIVLI